MPVLSAVCVTSKEVKRKQIRFGELIEEVGDLGVPREKLDFYFDDDCLLFSGMGDVHIHAREDVSGKNNYKEDFTTARAAARNGGLCHCGDMPNNPVPPIDDESYKNKFNLACEKARGEIWIYAGIGPGTKPLSFPVPYKAYMGPSVGDLFFKDLESLERSISLYQGQWVSFHCEDPEILEDHKGEKHHHLRRPISAEVVATRDALKLIEKYKLKGKLCHYSSRDGLNLIREARSRGVQVEIEVTPQHLFFDMEDLAEKDYGKYQMNPPIRYRSDKDELLAALKNGEIQYLATDHAPHTLEEKKKGTSGLTGLDTFAPFVAWLISQGVDLKQIALMTAENPGNFHNQFLPSWKKINSVFDSSGKGLGFLVPDYRANFTVINLKKNQMIETGFLKSKPGHSPFEGVEFPGSLEALFIKGKKL